MFESPVQRVYHELRANKWHFAWIFLLVFFISLLVLATIGFVPKYVDEPESNATAENVQVTQNVSSQNSNYTAPLSSGVLPERIIIPEIGTDIVVNNPASTDIQTLDNALLTGAVRYPGSGTLGANGNIFLFGHSSYLRTVSNDAFRAFNGIQKLEVGDTIRVQGNGLEYLYRVSSVKEVDADEAWVDLRSNGEQKLTLSTCNSFGQKSDRFVVEAKLVGSYPIAS